ncbi:histidine kinase-like ATPase, partial [Elsinoe ampelina]
MGIAALPQATVKALGSTQSIVNSTSVVKELIENALDANARSISVEISSNTLDVIQVKDNGHGIPPADRHLVAARYCTSKITNEQDLERVGSLSLGFRGEALSHIAEMSSELALTTRVDGEGAGSHLTFSRDGKLEKEQRKSHAVGTTVRVTKFLEHHPVRKQQILKAPRKIIDGILLLLHRFAFARPHIRFAFSVLKSNAAQDRWIYAPATEVTLTSTALKVVGQTAVSQCQFEQVYRSGVRIEALLPQPNADIMKLKRKGEYVILDGRPLAPNRGFGKRLLKEVKDHSGWKQLKNESAESTFICLVLYFDGTTYDATIEPSKDDVLIADLDSVLGLLRKLLDKVYP